MTTFYTTIINNNNNNITQHQVNGPLRLSENIVFRTKLWPRDINNTAIRLYKLWHAYARINIFIIGLCTVNKLSFIRFELHACENECCCYYYCYYDMIIYYKPRRRCITAALCRVCVLCLWELLLLNTQNRRRSSMSCII